MAATPASMLRIVTRGLQDIERLNTRIGQPSLEFYTRAIKRRTRWASQWRRVEFDTLADFGRRAVVTLPILGELITRVTLVVDLPDIYAPQHAAAASLGEAVLPHWSWTNSIGHAICSDITLTIGDQVVDQLDSRLMEVIDEQQRPVEHFDSTNTMIQRNPSDYSDLEYRKTPGPSTLEIVPPFWFNRGPGPQALPIEALRKDKVQITVSFRDVQQLVYTSSRPGGSLPASPGSALPAFAGCPFLDGEGTPTGKAMPTSWHFIDAYWVVEYVSLEDHEAAAFRMADLQIPIEQHIAVPVTQTGGTKRVKIPLAQSGLVRDMTWVAQRVEAPLYNNYFLFSRDLNDVDDTSKKEIWWPDAQIPNWDYGDGYIRPGFSDRRSDPIAAATLWIRGLRRFEHEGPSFFRSLVPCLGCERAPLIDRYIYRYDFGFWPTGGLAEALDKPVDEVRGFANWDKMPSRELALTMNQEDCARVEWETDPTQEARVYPANSLAMVESEFRLDTEGFRFELTGSSFGALNPGLGGYVNGIVDYQRIRYLPGFMNLYVRTNSAGSAALVAHASTNTWIAVAGGGGLGSIEGAGGNVTDAASISFCGNNTAQTHAIDALGNFGGGGGGRFSAAGVGESDGIQMGISDAFVLSHQLTGGTIQDAIGGDGYYGGGSGIKAGGGGGSYVSAFVSQTDSGPVTAVSESSVRLVPMRRLVKAQPDFNVYVWLTRYNILRITGGRGAIQFAE